MAYAHFAELTHIIADKRYGYAELEQYQNLAAKNFTGECLMSYADDNICIGRGWDTELRKGLKERRGEPASVAITPINEVWKGSSTIVGINRTWYEKTNRFSGNRATDAYLCDLAEAAQIKPIRPDIKTLHLQRGKDGAGVPIIQDGVEHIIYGLPAEDDFGGYNAKNPIPPKYYHVPAAASLRGMEGTNVIVGKRRFLEDLKKLTMSDE